MPLPYQGRPGVRDLASPTLIPNFYGSVVNSRGGLDQKSPADMGAAGVRANASVAATIGGTITVGNTPSITLSQSQLPGNAVTYQHTVVTSETLAGVASALANGLNAALAAAGITGVVASTGTTTLASEAVITVSWSGPAGNQATLSFGTLGTLTATLSPVGGKLAGGSGVVFAANNFNYQYRGSTFSFYYGKAYQLDDVFLAKLAADDMPVV